MNHGRARWLSMVLACLLLFSCVAQADIQASKVTPDSKVAPASTSKSTYSAVSRVVDLATIPGVEVIRNGKSVTYKFKQPIPCIGNKIVTKSPVRKASVSSISLAPTEGVMGMNVTHNPYSASQPVFFTIKPSNAYYSITEWSSTNEDAVKINKIYVSDDYSYFRLDAQGVGTSKITLKTSNKKQASKWITVKSANEPVLFSSMSIGEARSSGPYTLKSKTLKAGGYDYPHSAAPAIYRHLLRLELV